MVQFIVPNNNSVSATLITALQNEFNSRAGEIDVHFGITYVDDDAGLQGLSLIYVANHFAAPPRYDQILDELVVAQDQFEKREELRLQQLEKLARKNAEIDDLDTKKSEKQAAAVFDSAMMKKKPLLLRNVVSVASHSRNPLAA
jgi:hypothetical protein